jgi:hypothetical protein
MSLILQVATDEQTRVADVVERIQARFPDVDRALVAQVVHDVHRSYDAATVRDFVLILVERDARDVLLQETRWVEV